MTSNETQATLYKTATGATYPSSLHELALPLPEILRLHPHISCAAVGGFIFTPPSSSLLLVRRSQLESAFPGFWEVPGGGVEAPPQDATLLDAVVREVKEEAGLTVTKINRCYGWIEFQGRSGRVWRKWNFEVEVAESRESVSLDPNEHDMLMWVDGEEALEVASLRVMEKQKDSILEAFRIRKEEIKQAKSLSL